MRIKIGDHSFQTLLESNRAFSCSSIWFTVVVGSVGYTHSELGPGPSLAVCVTPASIKTFSGSLLFGQPPPWFLFTVTLWWNL